MHCLHSCRKSVVVVFGGAGEESLCTLCIHFLGPLVQVAHRSKTRILRVVCNCILPEVRMTVEEEDYCEDVFHACGSFSSYQRPCGPHVPTMYAPKHEPFLCVTQYRYSCLDMGMYDSSTNISGDGDFTTRLWGEKQDAFFSGLHHLQLLQYFLVMKSSYSYEEHL